MAAASGAASDARGPRCWVCLEGSGQAKDDELISHGCACRELGTVHFQCLAASAKSHMERMLENIPAEQDGRLNQAFALYQGCPTCHLNYVESLGLRMARLGKESCDLAARAADPLSHFMLLLLGEDNLIISLTDLGLTLEAFTAMERRQSRLESVFTRTEWAYGGGCLSHFEAVLTRREYLLLDHRITNYWDIYEGTPGWRVDVASDMPIFAAQCRDLLRRQAVLDGRRSPACADTIVLLVRALLVATDPMSGPEARVRAAEDEDDEYVKNLERMWADGTDEVERLLREAIEIYSEAQGVDDELTLGVIKKCAHLCDSFALYTARDEFNSDALARLNRSLGEQHPTTLKHALAVSSTQIPPRQHAPLVDPVQMRKAVYDDARRRYGPDRSETRDAAGLYVSDLVRAGEYSAAVSVSLSKLEGDRAAAQSTTEIYNLFGTRPWERGQSLGIAGAIFGLLKTGKVAEARDAIAATVQVAESFMMPAAVPEVPPPHAQLQSDCQSLTVLSFSRFVAIFVHFGLQDAVERERIYRLCMRRLPQPDARHGPDSLCDFLKGGLAVALFQQRDPDPTKKLEAARLFRTIKDGHRRGRFPEDAYRMWFTQEDQLGFPVNVLWFNSIEYTELLAVSLNEEFV
eukprot:m.88570 g.88570  ORF g.88570 m.88570 type:complete len:634 (+) comp19998_c0_seq3:463-2364(+)